MALNQLYAARGFFVTLCLLSVVTALQVSPAPPQVLSASFAGQAQNRDFLYSDALQFSASSGWTFPFPVNVVGMAITADNVPGEGNAVVLVVQGVSPIWGVRWDGRNSSAWALTGVDTVVPTMQPLALQVISDGGAPPFNVRAQLCYLPEL